MPCLWSSIVEKWVKRIMAATVEGSRTVLISGTLARAVNRTSLYVCNMQVINHFFLLPPFFSFSFSFTLVYIIFRKSCAIASYKESTQSSIYRFVRLAPGARGANDVCHYKVTMTTTMSTTMVMTMTTTWERGWRWRNLTPFVFGRICFGCIYFGQQPDKRPCALWSLN